MIFFVGWILFIAYTLIFNSKAFYKIYFFLVIMIPFNDKVYEFLGLKKGNISILDLILFLILILSIKSYKSLKLSSIDIIFIIIAFLTIIYLGIGIKNNNNFINLDTLNIIRIFIIYATYRIYFSQNNLLKEYIDLFLKSLILFSLINIFIYFFRESIIPNIYDRNSIAWWGTTRVSFSNASNFLLVPFFINNINMKKYIKIVLFINTIICIFLSKNRTLIILYFLIYIITYIFKNRKTNISRFLDILAIIVIIIVIFINKDILINKLILSNNDIFQRFVEVLEGNISSLNTRSVTNEFNLLTIKDNDFLGYGLGKSMILYNSDFSYASIGAFIDNGILTIIMKMGIITFSLIVIAIIIINFKIFTCKDLKLYSKFSIIFSAIGYLFLVFILNSQVIYSLPVFTTMLILLTLSYNKFYEIKSE
ncbi:hypothetical protein [Clostridium intestinale]|uniref:O-antigen ligase like membrane protein n=1 Tax=Clostridium intestinale DSM 6191 TaxID=1121320 RepID=A0A1M6DKL5_9CLOT|nr:hypothetical protein [Clostridium intestinale]SHI73887.1 hypothetical protein SAMN02745941_04256 [Clostridium intestinale DSM 6191]